MSDEIDSYDHEREKLLAHNVFEIRTACNDLSRLSENIRDIGLDKLADNIDIIWIKIRENTTDIQDRYEYVYKVKETKHFTVCEEQKEKFNIDDSGWKS